MSSFLVMHQSLISHSGGLRLTARCCDTCGLAGASRKVVTVTTQVTCVLCCVVCVCSGQRACGVPQCELHLHGQRYTASDTRCVAFGLHHSLSRSGALGATPADSSMLCTECQHCSVVGLRPCVLAAGCSEMPPPLTQEISGSATLCHMIMHVAVT